MFNTYALIPSFDNQYFTKLKQLLKLVSIEKYKEVVVNMRISGIIKKFYQNRLENIKKIPIGYQKDIAIGNCFRKVKSCFEMFCYGVQTKFGFRGRKK